QGMPTGGDRDGPRANATSALHVERRVADDPDAVGRHRAVEAVLDFAQRFVSHVVAVQMAVAETAEREMMHKAIMAKLHARSGANIAGEQADGNIVFSAEPLQKRADARKHASLNA